MIITSIKLQNFLSFKEVATMSFLVNENAPKTSHFGSCNEGSRYSRVSSIFGANASGKSNLMLGFCFLKWFISKSFSNTQDGFEGFSPFKTIKKQPSSFEVEFYIKKVFYKFSLQINSERVLLEVLECRKKKRLITLYSRKYMNNSYTFSGKNINLEDSFIKNVRPSASVISTARQYNHPELSLLRDQWTSIYKKIKQTPFIKDHSYLSDFYNISEFYSKNKDHFLQTKEFLKKADLGLSDIKIETREVKDSRGNIQTRFLAYGLHQNKTKKFQLPFPLESGGTLHLYEMLSFIFQALKKDSVCLIDDIDNHLHPNMLPTIVDLFTSKETNPKGAQLICTTHMPTLITDLSKYQIFLVEKNKNCESEVYRLDEIKDIRSDDNLFKKYLAGAYGGIPDIDI